jgi:hypothetical protein
LQVWLISTLLCLPLFHFGWWSQTDQGLCSKWRAERASYIVRVTTAMLVCFMPY